MAKQEEYAIEIKGLTRRFGSFTAVDNLTLNVKKGELFGFLGPNGAGKTTTINMLTTLLRPTEGTAKVAGYDLVSEDALVRSCIGVVPQKFSLFEELTPMENMWYIGELYSMDRSVVKKRAEELLKIVSLYDKKDVKSGTFSGGMKQRLSVAVSLLHSPKILFMDEPTTGLDPQSRIALRELTLELNRRGITIIYTTHDMEEADKLCQRIAIMDKGKLIALGTSKELKALEGEHKNIYIEMEREPSSAIVEKMKAIAGAISARTWDGVVELEVPAARHKAAVRQLAEFIVRQGIELREIKFREPTLEDVFIALTKKELRD